MFEFEIGFELKVKETFRRHLMDDEMAMNLLHRYYTLNDQHSLHRLHSNRQMLDENFRDNYDSFVRRDVDCMFVVLKEILELEFLNDVMHTLLMTSTPKKPTQFDESEDEETHCQNVCIIDKELLEFGISCLEMK